MSRGVIKNIAQIFIVSGFTALFGGISADAIIGILDRRDYNTDLKKRRDAAEIEKEHASALLLAEKAEQVKLMNPTEFAEFKAREEARANDKVKADAHKAIEKAKAEANKAKIDCDAKVLDIRRKADEKVLKANKAREEAEKKYEQLDKLFYNRREIEEAADSIKKANKSEKSIKILLED